MVTSRFSRVLPIAILFAWLPAAASVAQAAAPNVQDANQAFRQGNNPAALEKVNTFLVANPKDAQGRFLKGLILTELNRYNDAVKVFSDLTEDYPELPEPYNNLAVLYAAQAQYDRAKNSLEMAIRTHPSYATAHENLGDIYAKMASQSYDKALQLDKSNTSALTKLAMIRDLFSPAQMLDAGKSKAPAKAGTTKTGQLAQAATAPVKVEETTKPQVVPVAASKPVEVAAVAIDPSAEIERTIHAWAEVWSQRDAEAYLAFYSKDFKVPGGGDRAEWETDRKTRVTRPEFIKVELDRIKIKLQGDSAKVSFTQSYTSNTYKDKGKKTLVLEKQDDAWKIVEER
ncbi:MAG: tetratricopeptide repeat protein [Gammaproteobacteria bacterium]|nr:tetratricopeptide repeat protein [Gammaproteobacteria bacterium]